MLQQTQEPPPSDASCDVQLLENQLFCTQKKHLIEHNALRRIPFFLYGYHQLPQAAICLRYVIGCFASKCYHPNLRLIN